jgi:mono/diheme cytochrome c family protein
MKTALYLLSFLIPAFLVMAQEKSQQISERSDSIARGKYIVEQVAMCIQCHTPRDKTGQLLTSEYLKGAPVPVSRPPYPGTKWAIKAPAIAGLPGYTNEQGIRLLMQGVTADGRRPDPPMPPFRFNRSDAAAVVSYLKSLQ